MSKGKLWNLCDECIGDLQDCGYEVTPLEVFLPTIGVCDQCKAAHRKTRVAVRKCAIGKRKRTKDVDKPVENLVESSAVTELQRFRPSQMSLNLY